MAQIQCERAAGTFRPPDAFPAKGCSMRIGEILGLTWDCVDCSDESLADGTASVFINKQLRRCQKQSLQSL